VTTDPTPDQAEAERGETRQQLAAAPRLADHWQQRAEKAKAERDQARQQLDDAVARAESAEEKAAALKRELRRFHKLYGQQSQTIGSLRRDLSTARLYRACWAKASASDCSACRSVFHDGPWPPPPTLEQIEAMVRDGPRRTVRRLDAPLTPRRTVGGAAHCPPQCSEQHTFVWGECAATVRPRDDTRTTSGWFRETPESLTLLADELQRAEALEDATRTRHDCPTTCD
jgi:hypothetical protein